MAIVSKLALDLASMSMNALAVDMDIVRGRYRWALVGSVRRGLERGLRKRGEEGGDCEKRGMG